MTDAYIRRLYLSLHNMVRVASKYTTHARVTGRKSGERSIMKNIDKTLDRLADSTVTALSWLNELAMLDMSASEEEAVKEVIKDFEKSGVTPDDEEYCLNPYQLLSCIDKDIAIISGLCLVHQKTRKTRLIKKLNNIKTLTHAMIRYCDEHDI